MINTLNIFGQSKQVGMYSTSETSVNLYDGGQKIVLGAKGSFDEWQGVPIPEGDETVYPSGRFPIPQTGTFTLKAPYNTKKILMMGTDDDSFGNPNFFRLMRTYGFPYKMNTMAERINTRLGADDDSAFGANDAPALFDASTKVSDLAAYLHSTGLGEVCMHGISTATLWNSDYLSDSAHATYWNDLYATYTNAGGTKTESELKQAMKEASPQNDIAQGASYVATSRATIETAFGFPISCIAMWGGNPKITVDGIELSVNRFRDTNYPYRENGWKLVSTLINVGTHYGNANLWQGDRRSLDNIDTVRTVLQSMSAGTWVDLYTHFWSNCTYTQWREIFDLIKGYVDQGEAIVVTPSQLYQMGEFI